MKDLPPYELTNLIRVYDIVQIAACSFFVIRTYMLGFHLKFICKCESFNFLNEYEMGQVQLGVWFFLLLRVFEFVETWFFILRKKNNQASFLHVYHHVSTVVLMWVFITFDTGEALNKKRRIYNIPINIFRTDGHLQCFDQRVCAYRYVHLLFRFFL